MDGIRFDAWTKRLAAGTSRRQILGGIAGGIAAAFGLSSADARVCPNLVCAGNPGVCGVDDECGCCVFGNGNSRCLAPRRCRQQGGVIVDSSSTTTTTTSTTPRPTTTSTTTHRPTTTSTTTSTTTATTSTTTSSTTTSTTSTTTTSTTPPPSPCTNGVKDGTETDIDCGGANCPPCGFGKSCMTGYDCESGICSSSNVCVNCEPNSTRSCYEGPGGTAGMGICQSGLATCLSDGSGYGACQGQVTPQTELCNGLDDDCDGNTDNGAICPDPPNALGICSLGECGFQCNSGFADCDGNPDNGCETNITYDPQHCGDCNVICVVANGQAGCDGGHCTIQSCNQGFANCDGLVVTGCEIDVMTDNDNCGTCGVICQLVDPSAQCVNGLCVV